MVLQPLVAQRFLIFGVSRSHSHTHTHTHTRLDPLDEWSARRRNLYLTTHNTHNRQTSVLLATFEPAIPASECPQTFAVRGLWTAVYTATELLRKIQSRIWTCRFPSFVVAIQPAAHCVGLCYFVRAKQNVLVCVSAPTLQPLWCIRSRNTWHKLNFPQRREWKGQ
jgi:hypothetical protein